MAGLAKSVAIIGAGPVGLAAAAHALERGLSPVVLEAGDVSDTQRESGAMSVCSRLGNTTSIARRNGSLLVLDGIRPIRSTTQPVPNWWSAIWNRLRT